MDTMSVTVATGRPETSVAGARESARDFLEGLLHPIASEAADTVILVVSELVTNALRHGGGACILDLTSHPDSIEVAVHDRSPRPPRMRTPDLNGGSGPSLACPPIRTVPRCDTWCRFRSVDPWNSLA